MSDNASSSPRDNDADLARLRNQVQSLVDDRTGQALSQAAESARQYAHDAREMAEDQAEALSERVREAPIVAILIATAVGYILGRVAR